MNQGVLRASAALVTATSMMLLNPIRHGILFLAVCASVKPVVARQAGPELAILRRASAAIKSAEGVILNVGSTVTAPPLMREQRGVASATWNQAEPPGTLSKIRVTVIIVGITTADAASHFFDERRVAAGWRLEPYALGDQADLGIYGDSLRYEINFRKGRFLVSVGGFSRDDVERIARYVLQAATDG